MNWDDADDAAENSTEPELQLFDEQHAIALPNVDEPNLADVHEEPDGTHVYVFVAEPNFQNEEVWKELEL